MSYFFDKNVGEHIDKSLYFIELVKSLTQDTIKSNIEFVKKEVTLSEKNTNENIDSCLKNIYKIIDKLVFIFYIGNNKEFLR